ncbi:membrane protein [Bacteroidia bacterium]|nr:membrane protein [Bacteroidia bacterium]
MKTHNFKIITTSLLLSVFFVNCSDDFLQEKKDYSGFNEEIFDDVKMAQAKVDYIYNLIQPTGPGGTPGATLEGFGSTSYTGINTLLEDASNVPDEFFTSNTGGPWARIRECNIFLDNIDKGKLTEEEKKTLKGEVYFWRAYLYSKLVVTYGGVPIITTAQNAILGDGDPEQSELNIQRSSTAECIEFVCSDLDNAIEMLPGRWPDSNWGRITSGAAAAVKGQLLLTYASPLFNRTDDQTRWQNAYNANKAAYDLLIANNFGLEDGGGNRAANWEKMFVNRTSKEAVFVTLFNNITNDQFRRLNGVEQSARPKEIQGGGGSSSPIEMVDLFPMEDGKKPGESIYPYDTLKFYKNRDPRFYRTFAFNGVCWPYTQNKTYTLWNYQWFANEAAFTGGKPGNSAQYSGDVTGSIFVRKRTNPDASFVDGWQFQLCPSPWMEIRFAEVVLNLAESACGINKLTDAYELLKDIRKRVGYTGDCGLDISLTSNRDKLFGAILYERQIELAFEGKRFQDMRRWMLWNNDFGTCARLGVEPINGKRRHGVFLGVKPTVYVSGSAGLDNDPFNPAGKKYDPSKITREGISLDPNADNATFNAQIAKLDKFYDTNLQRLQNDQCDGTSTPVFYINFQNQYYFIGIRLSVLRQSPYLYQTTGWKDAYNNQGTFDPLN